MRALTLWRPWDSLVVDGMKRIENRPWKPGRRLEIGDWFAIHAGKVVDPRCAEMCKRLMVDVPDASQAGHVVGAVRYAGCVTDSEDPWFFGPFGWKLDRAVRCSPWPIRGAQGLWHLSEEISDHVIKAIDNAMIEETAK